MPMYALPFRKGTSPASSRAPRGIEVEGAGEVHAALPAIATRVRVDYRITTPRAWAVSPEAASPKWAVRRLGPVVLALRIVALRE
jgi:hypothetical protein